MLEVELTGQRSRVAIRSGQNALQAKKITLLISRKTQRGRVMVAIKHE